MSVRALRVRAARARTLRARLVTAAALAVGLALGSVVLVGYLVVRRELRGQVDRQLFEQVSRMDRLRGFGGFPGLVNPNWTRFVDSGGYLQITGPDGAVSRPPEQQATLPLADVARVRSAGVGRIVYRDATLGGAPIRMVTMRAPSGVTVQAALHTGAIEGQLRRLAVAFGGLGVAGLGLAIGLAWMVSRPVLAPVVELTDTAERIAATRDLTHRIEQTGPDELGRLAASFNSMLQALAESVDAQRQLVADASHELRTPLASLRTNVEVLQRFGELPVAEREELLAAIVGQLAELTALVGDVVELARGEEPEQHWTELAFDRIVAHAAERAGRHWPAVRFDLALEPVWVWAAPDRLDRAVVNLLDNAAKFSLAASERPAPVEVRLTGDGRLTVRDHGPGLPAEAVAHVFDRFYRADEARRLPGSGLGLAIVKQVADSHRGSVTVCNAAGGGVRAELVLPVMAPTGGSRCATLPENLL
ncbi:MAG: HAMP domain-containing histidine kinase [Actinobacteria bacterium]|nr:HAMP domain-containing histidine kinase [Actinomycetota bacterium]MBI3686501.1 HAMP domain-containing histidine kinase [Actinomycetota bacterium]